MKLRRLLRVCLFAATSFAATGCKKSREDLCKEAHQGFRNAFEQQKKELQLRGDTEKVEELQKRIDKAEPRFDAFCAKLSDTDIDCLEKMPGSFNDPKCAHTVEITKKDLYGIE